MKSYLVSIVLFLLFTSCKENTTQISNEKSRVKELKEEVVSEEIKSKSNSNYLCQINGQDWNYTKASGIVSTHARTKKRTATVTFKKKLEKGSENIQLTYDAISFKLIKASLLSDIGYSDIDKLSKTFK